MNEKNLCCSLLIRTLLDHLLLFLQTEMYSVTFRVKRKKISGHISRDTSRLSFLSGSAEAYRKMPIIISLIAYKPLWL